MHHICGRTAHLTRVSESRLHSVPAVRPSLLWVRIRRPIVTQLLRFGIGIVLALLIQCGDACATFAGTTRVGPSDPYAAFVAEASQRFSLPAPWLRAVMQVESGRNPKAVSPKGAMGLMQLMPDTWFALRLQYRLGNDPFDPHDNILGGAAYLRELFDRFGASGFFAAYNAGPKRYQDYLAGLRPLSGETRRYLSTLGRMLPDLQIDGASPSTSVVDDWHASGLFVGQATGSPSPNTAPSDSALANTIATNDFAQSPRSDGLFVPVSMSHQR